MKELANVRNRSVYAVPIQSASNDGYGVESEPAGFGRNDEEADVGPESEAMKSLAADNPCI